MFKTKSGRMRPWTVLALLAVMAPVFTGCYGNFQATKSIYKFNGEVSDEKIVRSVVLWGFLILPVYEIGALADLIVLNPIEYWQGTKINVGSKPDTKAPEAAVALARQGEAR